MAPHLILDTNVLLEIFSAADLYRAAELKPAGEIDSLKLRARRARIRESLLLAWYLSESGQTSRSHGDEATRTLTRDADPGDLREFRSQFVQVSIYFVKDFLFERWNASVESGDSRGNQADRALVARAKEFGVPLVSHEVHADKALMKAARREGVQVVTPREYWQPHQKEDEAVGVFLTRFEAAAAETAVAMRLAYFKYVLLGQHRSGALLPVTRAP